MKALLLCICALVVSTPASANDTWLGYIDWLVDNSEYEYNGEPLPTVEYHSPAMLQILIYGEEHVAQAELNGWNIPDVWGAYNDGVMYLPEGADYEHPHTIVTVVHELYHFLQDINGVTAHCSGLLEREAYKLHWQYAVEHELDVEEPNWLFVAMLEMSCYEPHY